MCIYSDSLHVILLSVFLTKLFIIQIIVQNDLLPIKKKKKKKIQIIAILFE